MMRCAVRRMLCLLVCLSTCLPVSSPEARADYDLLDSPMYKAPDLTVPQPVLLFPEKAKDLWLKALERPEADLRRNAADAVALAQRRQVKGLETTVAPLLAALEREDHPTVRLAIARALVTLDARQAAEGLLRQARAGGSDLREIIEPALARWDHRPARAMWLERLRDDRTPRRSLVLAMQSLAVVREVEAVDRLRELALAERRDGPIRLEAARALGILHTEGLEEAAERLLPANSAPPLVARLVAASLLRQHRGAKTLPLLLRLAEDPEPAVVALAAARLLEIDPQLLLPTVEKLLAGPDPKLRSLAVEVLFRLPTEKHVRLLADRLDDAHAEVRGKACRHLRELAGKKEWRDAVIAGGTRLLGMEEWRGLEQAAILLAQLDYKPAARRLVELLKSDRPEVFITAAWGLRKLAVAETLPDAAHHVETIRKRIFGMGGAPLPESIPLDRFDHQLSQLNQFLGQQKYEPADALLRQFIPHRMGPAIDESRAAAVWALGLIHEGKTDPALARDLETRLNDVLSIPPEDNRVRQMSALSLGRMKAKETLPSLRRNFRDGGLSLDAVNNASGWAIEQITGEPLRVLKLTQVSPRDYFLLPDK
jgi:HEAT repeat protein